MNLERKLQAPFEVDDLEHRVAQSGVGGNGPWIKYFTYVSNRAIQSRLDEVVGAARWRVDFADWRGTSQLCHLSIFIDEMGEWVTKTDGAEDTDFEPIKGGLSQAMKRAAVQWGIGRYLYRMPEAFAEVETTKQVGDGWHFAKVNNSPVWWRPQPLPAWALPKRPLEEAREMRDITPSLIPVSDFESGEVNYYTLLKTPPTIQGKVEVIDKLITVWVDSVHTPDHLDAIANAVTTLKAAKHITPQKATALLERISKAADALSDAKVKQLALTEEK